MILDTGTIIAITIALLGCLLVIFLFWRQNMQLLKENLKLHNELMLIKQSRFNTKR
jgi:hypothetical protein